LLRFINLEFSISIVNQGADCQKQNPLTKFQEIEGKRRGDNEHKDPDQGITSEIESQDFQDHLRMFEEPGKADQDEPDGGKKQVK
jgi:hypothetical protein